MITLYKIGYSDDDNFRSDAEYHLIPLDRYVIGEYAWFRDVKNKNVLFHTEYITKIGDGFLKSRRCKYIIQTPKEL